MSEQRTPAGLREHARATLVPAMAADEYADLVASIREHGILEPLVITPRGVTLDGRHRRRAALELGLETVPVRVERPDDEVEFMLGAALHRRHLSPSQRAALALELDEYQREKAAAAQRRKRGRKLVATLPQAQARTRELAAKRAGVSARLVQDAASVKEADPDLFEEIKAGSIPAHRAAKRIRRQRMLEALPASPPLPQERFEVIYADPPWRSQSPESGWSPEQHYPTMTAEEIAALNVPAAENAVLFLWIVNASLPKGLQVMQTWGFEYKTNLAWVKPSIGLGHWARNRHELLLLGTRGRIALPDEPDRPDSVIEAERKRHSEKPACVYELIERMFPARSRLELFARTKRPGWAAWGNEVAA